MKRQDVSARIQEIGLIPALRLYSEADALFAAEAIFHGGVPIVEVSMTVPDAANVISRLVRDHPDALVGAGSVLDAQTAHVCLDAGACFVTGDGLLQVEVVGLAAKSDVAVIPGALTPTEVISAWKIGCDFVKVVPCVQIGGVTYIHSLAKMFPDIPLIAAGGVADYDVVNFIMAGAVALGIGRALVEKDALRNRRADRIAEYVHRYLGLVKSGRQQLAERHHR